MIAVVAHPAERTFLQGPADVVSFLLTWRDSRGSMGPEKIIGVGGPSFPIPELR